MVDLLLLSDEQLENAWNDVRAEMRAVPRDFAERWLNAYVSMIDKSGQLARECGDHARSDRALHHAKALHDLLKELQKLGDGANR